ncbi:RNA ligase [Endothiovibrio diazotrophicus]
MTYRPLDAASLVEAREKRRVIDEEYYGLRYQRLRDVIHGVPRGTALFDGRTVYGYPQIGRVLRLDSGLAEQFEAPVWAEEKVDGYNVRIFRLDGELIGLSRGGFICPFTCDRAGDFIDPALFDDHPDLVLCGEMAGPGNPYMEGYPPYVEEDVKLFIFDMMRLDRPGFLPQAERMALAERYRLPQPEIFGRFELDQVAPLEEILLTINDDGREGIVLKEDSPRAKRAKYVTSNTSVSDIRLTAHEMLDLPPEYFTNRILRLVLFMDEEGLTRDAELHRQLGEAFLGGLFDSVRQYKEEGRVYHRYRCRFHSRENAERLITRLTATAKRSQVRIVQQRLEHDGGHWLLEFDKEFLRIGGAFGHLMGGGLVFD